MLFLPLLVHMASFSSFKNQNVLCWNIRGLNSDKEWNSIKAKITECRCDVICLQETKKESFDLQLIRKSCPPSFDAFAFLPSVGASGGVITIWKSHLFYGNLVFSNEFGITVEFISNHNAVDWVLTNVYGPCTSSGKQQFTHWLKLIQMPSEVDWLLLGDFKPPPDP